MKAVLFLAGLLLATAGVVVPAAAQNYPWCAQYSGGDAGGGRNCGFSTFAQCLADVSGIGGFCERNNTYQPGPVSHKRRPPQP
jgi:hypothetical protein